MSQAGAYRENMGPFGPILQLTPDNGNPVTPLAGNIDVLGGNNSNAIANIMTDGNPFNEPGVVPLNTLKIRLTDSIILPGPNSTTTSGVYALGLSDYVTDRFMYHRLNSVILGYQAGNFTGTGNNFNVFIGDNVASQIGNDNVSNVVIGYNGLTFNAANFSNNTGVGHLVFNNNRQGQFNSAFGFNAMSLQINPGTYNTAIGEQTLVQVTGNYNTACGAEAASAAFGSNNTCIGAFTASNISAGADNNTCLGAFAGSNLQLNDSNNLIIAHAAVAGDNGKIRIGTTGTQTECYIGAIAGVAVGNTQLVTIDSVTEQLGSISPGVFASVYDADSGSASPAAGVLNIYGGTGISTSGAGNTITISSTVVPGSWSVITLDQTAVVNEGYFCNKAGTLALALPAASAVGDIIEVANINTATGTQITQGAGQQIRFGSSTTTLGAGGSLTSIALGDCLKLVCSVANTTWVVISSVGSWTIV